VRRRGLVAVLGAALVLALSAGQGETAAKREGRMEPKVEQVLGKIEWLGHDTFRVEGPKRIYTDPFKLAGGKPADLILITHDHYDHCSPDDIARIQNAGTTIVCPPDCQAKLVGKVQTIRPGEKLKVEGIEIESVPAYNTDKKFHPQANGWVGYIFTVEGVRIYLAGDTDRIPEMKQLRCDIALLPVGGTYTMTAEEAVQAALDLKPQVAVPMHYASIVGTEADARKFAQALKGKVEVRVLPRKQGVGAP
jgi:L-ascorbate metabolism protein UlaG (beta-lactamase superfamily)